MAAGVHLREGADRGRRRVRVHNFAIRCVKALTLREAWERPMKRFHLHKHEMGQKRRAAGRGAGWGHHLRFLSASVRGGEHKSSPRISQLHMCGRAAMHMVVLVVLWQAVAGAAALAHEPALDRHVGGTPPPVSAGCSATAPRLVGAWVNARWGGGGVCVWAGGGVAAAVGYDDGRGGNGDSGGAKPQESSVQCLRTAPGPACP